MSKEMDQIFKIVQDKQTNCVIQPRTTEKERIELENRENAESQQRSKLNKKILDNLGIAELFNEIIVKGLLKFNDNPVVEEIPVYKNTVFKSRVVDYWECKKISKYTPAFISYGHENKSISLCFNSWSNENLHGDIVKSGYKKITAVVTPQKAVSLGVKYYDPEKGKYIENQVILNRYNLGQAIGAEVAKHI